MPPMIDIIRFEYKWQIYVIPRLLTENELQLYTEMTQRRPEKGFKSKLAPKLMLHNVDK